MVHVQLIASKNKVAPLKLCMIPRLELQAAVLAVKVDALLKRELDLDFSQSYFWTDSEIKYIRNDSGRFRVFVGNRVSLIRELSDPGQWFYVETKANPADLVTRGQSYSKWLKDKWFNGPDKLHRYKSEWGLCDIKPANLLDDDPEVRKTPSVTVCDAVTGNDLEIQPR